MSSPVVQPAQETPAPPAPEAAPKLPVVAASAPATPSSVPASSPTPTPTPTPDTSRRKPTPAPSPTPKPPVTAAPAPTPTPTPTPPPAPAPPPVPVAYRFSELTFDVNGDGTKPEIRLGESSWVWQRYGVSIAGTRYAHGVTVHGDSSVTVDLNRRCSAYDALVGVDDLTLGLGTVHFSVYADGVPLWNSGPVGGDEAAVPVHVSLAGRSTVRLVVRPHSHLDSVALADWAESKFTCTR